jgi:hypothetical protein
MDIRILVFLTVILIFRCHQIRIKFVILQEIFDIWMCLLWIII